MPRNERIVSWETAWQQEHEKTVGRAATDSYLGTDWIDLADAAVNVSNAIANTLGSKANRAELEAVIQTALEHYAEKGFIAGAKAAHKSNAARVKKANRSRKKNATANRAQVRQTYRELFDLPQMKRLAATAKACGVSISTVRRFVR